MGEREKTPRPGEIEGLAAATTGIGDPNQSRRDYDLSGGRPLVGLLDNPWYPPYIRDKLHSHNCMEIGLCMTGCGQLSIGRRTWRYGEGAVLVVPGGVDHDQQNEGQPVTHWRYVLVNERAYIAETPERLRPGAQQMLRRIAGGLFFQGSRPAEVVMQICEAMFHRYRQCRDLGDMMLDAQLRLLMAQLSDVSPDLPESDSTLEESHGGIVPALNYVSENYALEIRVEDLAASCAMSESYFRKIFVRAMRMPPLEYVNRFRINRSIHLLYATDHTVQAIAAMTGFSSMATYNRNFRRYVGVSPAEWRKNALGQ